MKFKRAFYRILIAFNEEKRTEETYLMTVIKYGRGCDCEPKHIALPDETIRQGMYGHAKIRERFFKSQTHFDVGIFKPWNFEELQSILENGVSLETCVESKPIANICFEKGGEVSEALENEIPGLIGSLNKHTSPDLYRRESTDSNLSLSFSF